MVRYLFSRSRKYWYSVPYPSSYHWWEGIQSFPWLAEPQAQLRNILSLFIGSVKTLNIDSNAFRRVLWMQCMRANNLLPSDNSGRMEPHATAGGSLGGQTACHWYNTSHSCNGLVNSAEQLLLLRTAQYCLAPPGDTVTVIQVYSFQSVSLVMFFFFLRLRENLCLILCSLVVCL